MIDKKKILLILVVFLITIVGASAETVYIAEGGGENVAFSVAPDDVSCNYLSCTSDIVFDNIGSTSFTFDTSNLDADIPNSAEWKIYSYETYSDFNNVTNITTDVTYKVFHDNSQIITLAPGESKIFKIESTQLYLNQRTKYSVSLLYNSVLHIVDPFFVTNSTNFANGDFNQTILTSSGRVQLDRQRAELDSFANFTDILAYYRFNETSGNIIDYSGNGNDGQVFGTVAYGVEGRFEEGFQTLAADSRINTTVNINQSIRDGGVTIMGWFRNQQNNDAQVGSSERYWAAPRGSGGSSWILEMRRSKVTGLMGVSHSGGFDQVNGLNQTTRDKWEHVVVTMNGSEIGSRIALYINGVLQEEKITATILAEGNVGILDINFADFSTNFGPRLIMDEFAVWNRPLQEAEILSIFNVQKGFFQGDYESEVFDAGIVSSWQDFNVTALASGFLLPNRTDTSILNNFLNETQMVDNVLLLHINETSGTFLKDLSGRGHDGTIVGPYELNQGMPVAGGVFLPPGSFINLSGDIDADFHLESATDFTWCMWQRFNGTIFGFGNPWITSTRTDGSLGYQYRQSQNTLSWRSQTNNGGILAYKDDNTPFHTCATKIGGFGTNYFRNGQLVSATTSSGSSGTLGQMFVGGNETSTAGITISEVAAWTRQLSSQEVQAVYERGLRNMGLSVRSCNDAACAGESYIPLPLLASQEINISDNRFFQYKIDYDQDISFIGNPPLQLFSASTLLNASPPDQPAVCQVNLSNCQVGGFAADTYYCLTQDVASAGTCMTVDADNVVIDGLGFFKIEYGSGGVGQGVNIDIQDNVTIRNLTIEKVGTLGSLNLGIELHTATNSLVEDVIISTNGGGTNHGIRLHTNSQNNIIRRNTISTDGTAAANRGITLENSEDNLVTGNTIDTAGTNNNDGFYLFGNSNPSNNLITNNVITTSGSAGSNDGIQATTSFFDIFINNTISTSGGGASNHGFTLTNNVDNVSIINNTIQTSGTSGNRGINMLNSEHANVKGNNINTSGIAASNYGIANTGGLANNVTNNIVETHGTNNNYGMYLFGAQSGHNYVGNTITVVGTTTTNRGFFINGVSTSNFESNTIVSTSGTGISNDGIHLAGVSAGNTFTSNSINNVIGDGIQLTAATSDNNIFDSNTFSGVSDEEFAINTNGIDGTVIKDMSVGAYRFTTSNIISIEDSTNGRIDFLEGVAQIGRTNLFGDATSDVVISNNFVGINDAATGLNRSANITLFNVPLFVDAVILRNGVPCGAVCFNLTSLEDGGTIKFNVTGFSNYTINGTPAIGLVISDIQVPVIGDTSATITWTTTQGSNSTVNFGFTTALGTIIQTPGSVTSHSIGITGLIPSTTYFYNVSSANPIGFDQVGPNSFSTIATPPPTAGNLTGDFGDLADGIKLVAVIIGLALIALIIGFLGFMTESPVLRFFAFFFVFLELIFTAFILYVSSTGASLTDLLQTNYKMLLISGVAVFIVGGIVLVMSVLSKRTGLSANPEQKWNEKKDKW